MGCFPPVMSDVKYKSFLLQTGELLEVVTVKGMLANVPNEISSSPKSFPLNAVCKSTICMVAEVELPEFQVP